MEISRQQLSLFQGSLLNAINKFLAFKREPWNSESCWRDISIFAFLISFYCNFHCAARGNSNAISCPEKNTIRSKEPCFWNKRLGKRKFADNCNSAGCVVLQFRACSFRDNYCLNRNRDSMRNSAITSSFRVFIAVFQNFFAKFFNLVCFSIFIICKCNRKDNFRLPCFALFARCYENFSVRKCEVKSDNPKPERGGKGKKGKKFIDYEFHIYCKITSIFRCNKSSGCTLKDVFMILTRFPIICKYTGTSPGN